MEWSQALKTPPMVRPKWKDTPDKLATGSSQSQWRIGSNQEGYLMGCRILEGNKNWGNPDIITGKSFVSPRESFDLGESNPFFARPSMLSPAEVKLQGTTFGKRILESKGIKI